MISQLNTLLHTGAGDQNTQEYDLSGVTSLLASTDLHNWQGQACIAFFKAKVRANNVSHLTKEEASKVEEYYQRRRQDLITLGVSNMIPVLDEMVEKAAESVE